jgi:ubiquinol-cytochrome c reductase cytochrome b subunit
MVPTLVPTVVTWLCDRCTVGPETYKALNKGLPKGVGWLNTLGSTAMTLIMIQVITGTFLAMYYSPHPDASYEAMRYIDHQVPMGNLVHGLHHYGASAVVLVVFVHLLRTYFHGAYKAPREMTWIMGIIIFNVILALGFTGYLLPWDQKAYWATQVGTKIPEGIPVAGPMIQQLMRGGTEIGALTITRFYALHVLLLPAILVPLLVGHLLLVWRKGPTPPGSRVGEKVPATSKFVDHQLFKDSVAMFVVFGIVFALALFKPVELEFKANPTDPSYHPRPEWYFLFLFQFLNDFAKVPILGKLPAWVPAVVLPGIAMTFLALAPWIDRGPERKVSRRPLMVGVMLLGLLGVVGFTMRAYSQMKPNATPKHSLYAQFTGAGAYALLPDQVMLGREAFAACGPCHRAYDDYQGTAGPDLTGYGFRTFLSEVEGHPEVLKLSFYERFEQYVRGDIRVPNSMMPNYSVEMLSRERLDAIGAYLSQTVAEAEETTARASAEE